MNERVGDMNTERHQFLLEHDLRDTLWSNLSWLGLGLHIEQYQRSGVQSRLKIG